MTFLLYNGHDMSWNLLYVCCSFISFYHLPVEANLSILYGIYQNTACWLQFDGDEQSRLEDVFASLSPSSSSRSVIPDTSLGRTSTSPTFHVKAKPSRAPEVSLELQRSRRDPGCFRGRWQCSPAKGKLPAIRCTSQVTWHKIKLWPEHQSQWWSWEYIIKKTDSVKQLDNWTRTKVQLTGHWYKIGVLLHVIHFLFSKDPLNSLLGHRARILW